MAEKNLQQHWNTICSSMDLAMRGNFPLGLESLDAHVAIRDSLAHVAEILKQWSEKQEPEAKTPVSIERFDKVEP